MPAYPPELVTLLGNYHFPGNVRELESMVNDAVARHVSGILSMERFREAILLERGQCPAVQSETRSFNNGEEESRFSYSGSFPTIKEVEEHLIAEAMERADGNQTIAADLLGITRQTLNKRITRSKKDS